MYCTKSGGCPASVLMNDGYFIGNLYHLIRPIYSSKCAYNYEIGLLSISKIKTKKPCGRMDIPGAAFLEMTVKWYNKVEHSIRLNNFTDNDCSVTKSQKWQNSRVLDKVIYLFMKMNIVQKYREISLFCHIISFWPSNTMYPDGGQPLSAQFGTVYSRMPQHSKLIILPNCRFYQYTLHTCMMTPLFLYSACRQRLK